MLTADAQLDVGARLSSTIDRGAHERSHPFTIQHREGIGFEDVDGLVMIDEFRRIVAGKSERRLREVVRAEREDKRTGSARFRI